MFLAIHNLLCALLFGGALPDWLGFLHKLFGWG